MKKIQNSSRNGLFFLIGAFVYSVFFWATQHNYSQVFGIIIVALLCNITYKMDLANKQKKGKLSTQDVIYLCSGAVFDSLSKGFPFGFLEV